MLCFSEAVNLLSLAKSDNKEFAVSAEVWASLISASISSGAGVQSVALLPFSIFQFFKSTVPFIPAKPKYILISLVFFHFPV